MTSKSVLAQATVQVKIPFHDVDLLEVAWHGHYVRYFEVARCELFEALQYSYAEMKASGYAWPVIELHVRYAKPAVFGDVISVQALLVEIDNRLKINYEVRNADGARLTRAHTVQVAVDMTTREMCMASPRVLIDKVARYRQNAVAGAKG